jgi:hypothetical protein
MTVFRYLMTLLAPDPASTDASTRATMPMMEYKKGVAQETSMRSEDW